MRRIEYSTAFKKDYKRTLKRGVDVAKLDIILSRLMDDEPLLQKNHPHMLSGEWRGFWECHITPDWHHDKLPSNANCFSEP